MKILVSFVMALLLAAPAVFGQDEGTRVPAKTWGAKGVTISVTPRWQTPSWYKVIYGAREVDLSGQAFGVGLVIRAADGHPEEGHLSFNFVNMPIDGQIVRGNPNAENRLVDRYIAQGATLYGIELYGITPITHGRSVRFGVKWSGGVGAIRGSALNVYDIYLVGRREYIHAEVPVPAKELITFHETPLPVIPMGGVELAVMASVGSGVEVGGSFGPHFPTGLRGAISLTWVP
ncbi:MAG: hypothetical protein AAB584_02100 [Patescibacteria group bacterium]